MSAGTGRTPDLAALTGVRSGKRSYYRAFLRSDERMQQAVRAMDSISRALVRTVEGPRALLEEVARAAAEHLAAEWTILALADGHLPGARPRFVVIGHDGRVVGDEEELPGIARRELGAIRAGHATGAPGTARWVRVPMTLNNVMIGSLVGLHGLADDPEPGDLSVMRILANEAAVALHTSEQYQAGLAQHRRAQRLYDEVGARERDLDQRTRELRQAEERLLVARQRELVDHERHRIARELHDSVTQFVLSAGMSVEVARGETEALGPAGERIGELLRTARQLTQDAVEQLRRAIYALHQPQRDTVSSLPELLHEVAEHHRPHLDVTVRVEGEVSPMPAEAKHDIARAVGEALFNVATHAEATRAVLRLRYRTHELYVGVADDGRGDPGLLARNLRVERGTSADGRHRGLANIEARVKEVGGTVAFRRSHLGGVRVELRVPMPIVDRGRGTISGLIEAPSSPSRRNP